MSMHLELMKSQVYNDLSMIEIDIIIEQLLEASHLMLYVQSQPEMITLQLRGVMEYYSNIV